MHFLQPRARSVGLEARPKTSFRGQLPPLQAMRKTEFGRSTVRDNSFSAELLAYRGVDSTTMIRRERVFAALRGEPVDRVPLSFWGHDYAAENAAASLAEVTLRRAGELDFDYLKPQSRAQCFAEMWGLTYQPSGERATKYTTTRYPLAGVADLARLEPPDPRTGALG